MPPVATASTVRGRRIAKNSVVRGGRYELHDNLSMSSPPAAAAQHDFAQSSEKVRRHLKDAGWTFDADGKVVEHVPALADG
eukprot:SAG22_NODE_16841_length_316_cov_1.198157_1_plen_80_part_01